jgi:hypothetical protein
MSWQRNLCPVRCRPKKPYGISEQQSRNGTKSQQSDFVTLLF